MYGHRPSICRLDIRLPPLGFDDIHCMRKTSETTRCLASPFCETSRLERQEESKIASYWLRYHYITNYTVSDSGLDTLRA